MGSRKVGLTDNPLTRLNYKASGNVEHKLRGSLAFDTALKGGDQASVIENVWKYHFNYDDLSQFEKGAMKRISPFYTWTRKNLPLQMEMVFRNPKQYARVGYVQDNIEGMTPPEGLVPAWFADQSAIRL